MKGWHGASVLAITVLLVGCASIRPRLDAHRDGWLLVETPHVELRTDLDRPAAIRRAHQLEQYWRALIQVYRLIDPDRPAPPDQIAVVHFANCMDVPVRSNRRPNFTFRTPWTDGLATVTCGDTGDAVLVHRLIHELNGHYVARMPTWLNEGLAMYFETLTRREGMTVAGDLPPYIRQLCQSDRQPGRSPLEPAWRLGLTQLRLMPYEDFHGDGAGCHHVAAWKLVHFLHGTGQDRARRFGLYLRALADGTASEVAWVQAFEDVPPGALEEEYRDYGLRTGFMAWGARDGAVDPAPPRVRPLLPVEAHLLWVTLLTRNDGGRAAAFEQLERLAAVAPDWPELLLWRAVLFGPPDGPRLLRAYLARHPEDWRGWRALVGAGISQAVPPGYLGLGGPPLAGLAALEPDVHRLARSSDAASLNLVGWYYALAQKPAAGLPFALRSVLARPACGGCWDTVALLYYQSGKLDDALRAQEHAVELMGERAGDHAVARLRHYRAAARPKRALSSTGER